MPTHATESMEPSDYHILVVDDEQDILEFLSYNLQKEGYNTTTADNGRSAIELAKQKTPDVIILDIMMPEMDGVETCRHLRQMPELDQTIITFLTARSEDYSQVAGLDAGADDYITKPIRPRVFLSRIQALLRRRRISGQEDPGQRYTVGDLTVDKEKVHVEKDGEVIHLAKKEFELLTLLTSKPGKVFSREEIFNKIWGTDVIVGNRTIDVHIRKLREKIGSEYIQTFKGIGYKFEF